MLCPNCQFENLEGRRFCSKCGAQLTIICPSCGFVNDPNDEFCGGCGELLSKSAAPETDKISAKAAKPERLSTVEAELRQVTILFADLSGFTKLSSIGDPEETHRLISRFFEAVDGVVESYGGTIDKHIGDAVMALFGAPVAHGNDPERAVRAALDIHEAMDALSKEMGLRLRVHIGVASGQVVASGLGSDRFREYTVTGESVNLAARLVAMAGPRETLISDPVYWAIPQLVEVDEIGDANVKGLERPVRVWRLQSLSAGDRQQTKRPLIGRSVELEQLHEVLESCRVSDTGQSIYVRGEAGIGKTRLVEEFAAVAAAEGFAPHAELVLNFGVGKGQDAIRGILRSLLEIPADTDEATRTETAGRAVAERLIDADQLVFLHDLLDVPQDAEKRAIYDAMTNDKRNRGKQDCVAALLSRLSQRQPLLIIVEDLQWADSLTLAHLAAMASTVATCPALLVMTSRIEGDPLDQGWRQAAGSTSPMIMDLAPLRDDEALAFADEFGGASRRLVAACVRRAEGNPFFLEQLLYGVLASENQAVPGSVRSLVLGRVDRLSEADKRAVKAAAVLGQRFPLEVLRFLIDDQSYDCDGLIEHHLLRSTGDGLLLFTHALIWESVYSSLLRRRRRELHLRAAEWFANRDPTLRAEHLDRAEDPAAARAYFEAAQAQAQVFHIDRALKLAERGLAVARDAAEKYELLSLEGEYLRDSGRAGESVAVYKDALEVAENDIAKCLAWISLAAGMRITDEYEDALSALDEAQRVATIRGLDKELSQIHYYRGSLYFPLGNISGCLAEHKKALDYARSAGSEEAEARALSGLGDAYYSRGRMITSLDYFRRCIELCRAHRFGRIEVSNQYMVGWNRVYMNEVEEALEDSLSAIESASRVGHQRAEMVAELAAARVLVEKDDIGEAELHVERGLALAEWLGANRFIPFFMIFLGRIWLAQQRHRWETVGLMEEALEISRQTGIGFVGPWVLSTLARVSDDLAKAQSALKEGEDILSGDCVGHNYFDFYRDAIEAALNIGDWASVERYAAALEDYTREEPSPWSDFYIVRGRTLAAYGRGKREDATMQELRRLHGEADRVGLKAALRLLDAALAGTL